MTEREENNSADYGEWTDLIRGLEGQCFDLAVDVVNKGRTIKQLCKALEEALICLTSTFRDSGARHDMAIQAARAALSQARGETGEER